MSEPSALRQQTSPLVAAQMARNPDLSRWLMRQHLDGLPLPNSWLSGGGTSGGETLLSVGQ